MKAANRFAGWQWLAAFLLGFLPLFAQAAPLTRDLPQAEARPQHVADSVCAGCHAAQYRDWLASKHKKAMQSATSQTVLGNFKDASFDAPGGPTRFRLAAGQFTITTQGADGRMVDHPVSHTFGVHPLQQYLIPQAGGRLQAFTLAWDTVRHRWFDLQAEEPARPGESLHWSGRYQNWNLMCGECHTTAFRKNYDDKQDSYRTTWAAPHVGCQSCHGPGGEHAASAQRGKPAPTVSAQLKKAGVSEVDRCASCHARRTRLVEDEAPLGHFLDNFQPDNLRPELYHADGQQLAEVFEYGSYRQSRMYQAGVVCSDCHEPHGGGLQASGNALCVRCHNPAPDPRYPTLKAGNYDSPAHHFHATGQAGSQCVDCHMPTQNYMVVHARRDHAIRIPRPDLSARLNTPNACTQCHTDKEAAWAQAALERQFGQKEQPPHYGEVFAAARSNPAGAAADLAELGQNPQQPGIVRATAIELLARVAPQLLPPTATQDPDPVVRSTAAQALAAWPGEAALPHLLPLLDDARRAVRIAAARSLAGLDERALPAASRPLQRRALAEYVAAQQAMADMPAAQLNLASLRLTLRQPEMAGIHYQRALKQDPALVAARLALARWQMQYATLSETVATLRDGLADDAAPGSVELRHALALVLVRQGKLAEAEQELARALAQRPDDASLQRQLNLLRQRRP